MLVVVVIVDGHPDVVQHGRGPQQLALERVAGVQARAGELVEHAERKPRHVLGVRLIDVVEPGEVEHRLAADVVEELGGRQPAREEHALAQPGLGDLHALEPAHLEHREDRGRAGEDDVPALGFDPAQLPALAGSARGELVNELGQRVARDHVALHPERRDRAHALVGRREVTRGSPDRHQPVAGARHPVLALDLAGDVLAQRLAVLAEALGHPHGAQLPRPLLARQPPNGMRELQRAAAEIEHAAVAQRRRVDRGEVAVVGFLLGREHPHRQLGARDELVAVGRVADRAGGDRLDLVDPGRPTEVREDLDSGEAAAHRLGAQLPRGGQALADAHALVDLVGAAPPPLPRGEDHEAEGVGSEIGDGDAALGHCRAAYAVAGTASRARASPDSVATSPRAETPTTTASAGWIASRKSLLAPLATIALEIASTIAPPTWIDVLTRPEARPCS